MTALGCLLALFLGHFLGDYPFQGEYIAFSKDRNHAWGKGGQWVHSLTAHAFIHGAFVAALTNNILLGVAEFCAHFVTDFLKCEKKINIHVDQAIHLGCKVIWWLIWLHTR